jgi:hypothetical protein
MLDLEPIKARLAHASQGPWAIRLSGNPNHSVKIISEGRPGLLAEVHHYSDPQHGPTEIERDANAKLLAAARQDIPALVAEVERLRISLRARESEQSFHAACR